MILECCWRIFTLPSNEKVFGNKRKSLLQQFLQRAKILGASLCLSFRLGSVYLPVLSSRRDVCWIGSILVSVLVRIVCLQCAYSLASVQVYKKQKKNESVSLVRTKEEGKKNVFFLLPISYHKSASSGRHCWRRWCRWQSSCFAVLLPLLLCSVSVVVCVFQRLRRLALQPLLLSLLLLLLAPREPREAVTFLYFFPFSFFSQIFPNGNI